MSKNEVVNTFNGGLVMDLNPISTPNNVLTNCLNGTLITYNGNEYTLQSDMGNGRVETAYLPSGYVPVGIKEHGGIIYVASHNPITGKSQIGSFPSPERNISSEELNDSDAVINFSKFTDNLVQRIKLFGEEAVIRSGDKFSIIMIPNISGTSSDLSKLLSNYQNILDGKVKCLKNKLITLDVAVLDSNNNLHSITNTLKRFNQQTNQEIENSYQLAQDVKLNTEYFTQTFDSKLNISDSNSVDRFRSISARNTFNSKLIGNLCIIATLNTISQFEFSIGGTIEGAATKLYLDSSFEYNCPDGRYNNSNIYGVASDFDPDSSIIGYDISFENERVLERKLFKTSNINFDSDIYDEEYSCTKYNKENNLYISKQLDTYTISKNSGIVYYTATPISIVGPLNGLSISGQIDLDKIGSGEMNITNWRYYKNEDYVSLQWGLEYYPKYKESITDIRFLFYDIYQQDFNTPTYIYNIDKKRNYNGIFTELLHLPEWEGVKNKLFLVKIEYKLNTQEDFQVLDYKWLYNTRIHNNIYAKGELLDFSKDSEELKELRLLNILTNTQAQLSRTQQLTTSPELSVNTSQKKVYSQDSYINYNYTIQSNLSIAQDDYYPFEYSITFENEFDIDKEAMLEEAAVDDLVIQGQNQTDLITRENYKNFIKITEDYANSIKILSTAKLQFVPEMVSKNLTYAFIPIFDKELSVGNSSPACLIVYCKSRNDIKDPDSYRHIRFVNSQIESESLRNLYEGAVVVNEDNNNEQGRWVYGINQIRKFNYNVVLEQVKNTNQAVVILSSHKQEPQASWDDGSSGNPHILCTTQITKNFENHNEGFNFESAWWQSTSGTPVLIDIYTTAGKMTDVLQNSFGNLYKYSQYYSGQPVEVEGLGDNYGYNTDYIINFNIIFNITLSQVVVHWDAYTTAINSILNYFSPDNSEELRNQATFTYLTDFTDVYKSQQSLVVTGLDSLYSKLTSPNIDYGIGTIRAGVFTLKTLPTINLNIGNTYQVDSSNNITKASILYDQYFQEKQGKFLLRNVDQSTAHNQLFMTSYPDDTTMVLAFDFMPTAGISGYKTSSSYTFNYW